MNFEMITSILTVLISLAGVGTTAFYVARIALKGQLNAEQKHVADLQEELMDLTYEYQKLSQTYSNNLTKADNVDKTVVRLESQLAERRFSYNMCSAEMLFWRGKFQLSNGDDAMYTEREKWVKLWRMNNKPDGITSKSNAD